jgi:PAS domain S-box-containing protein
LIRSINPAAEALYGVPLREFSSGQIHILDFVHPEDMEAVKNFYDQLHQVEFDELTYRIISNHKQIKWVIDEGHVVYAKDGSLRRIDHVIRDITEEKKAQDALRESEAKYRDFFNSSNDMAFTLTPDGTFLDINDAGMKLLGFNSREEALSSNIEDFYVNLNERAGLIREIYTEGFVAGRQVRFKDKSGEVIEVAVTARAKIDEFGRLLYHEGIIHNITKAMEDQRNLVLRNAAGAMCHYLNTHLMQLLGSKDAVVEEVAGLATLLQGLREGRNPLEIADNLQESFQDIQYFCDGIADAYERISEVTKAFNQAFIYKEEEYLSSTILDIFKTFGFDIN